VAVRGDDHVERRLGERAELGELAGGVEAEGAVRDGEDGRAGLGQVVGDRPVGRREGP